MATTTTTTEDETCSADNEVAYHRNVWAAKLRRLEDNEPSKKNFMLYEDMDEKTKERHDQLKQLYRRDRLNEGQREIYDYVMRNPKKFVVIQAGAGTGKTFTLMTIGFALSAPMTVIIYKHDLLAPFKPHCRTFTVASFIMRMFGLNFKTYQYLEKQLSQSLMTGLELLNCLTTLLRLARIPSDLADTIVVLDEYTVVPKPLLLLIVSCLRYYRIGTIVCGDKNQLQNVHNSRYAKCSSFDLVTCYTDRIFALTVNERFTDLQYTRVIEYLATLSTDLKADDHAMSLVALLFMRKIAGHAVFNDTHLAATHQQIATAVDNFVKIEKIPVSYYRYQMAPNPSLKRKKPNNDDNDDDNNNDGDDGVPQPTQLFDTQFARQYIDDGFRPGKFLPYLPLSLNNIYYVLEHRDAMRARLVEIDEANLRLRLINEHTGEEYSIAPSATEQRKVVFPQHYEYLMEQPGGEQRVALHNYPIYPANIMTFHKCQGCTITPSLDINIIDATYQGIYVALSRVKTPTQIKRIIIRDPISHIVSLIARFPEIADHGPDDLVKLFELAQQRLVNFRLYTVSEKGVFADLIQEFLGSDTREGRVAVRKRIIAAIGQANKRGDNSVTATIVNRAEPVRDEVCGTIIKLFIDYDGVFFRLACCPCEYSRAVWLREFTTVCDAMSVLLDPLINRTPGKVRYTDNAIERVCRLSIMYGYGEATRDYLNARVPTDVIRESKFLTEMLSACEAGQARPLPTLDDCYSWLEKNMTRFKVYDFE